jgi:CheY-like chemotaxis protein
MPVGIVLHQPAIGSNFELMQEVKKSNRNLIVIAMTDARENHSGCRDQATPVFCKIDGMDHLLRLLELKLDIPLVTPDAKRVLIVDDDRGVAEFMRACLVEKGYFVYLAATGTEALELLNRQPGISVVLLDIMMPDKGGVDTLLEIQKKKHHPVVVMMTAVNDAAIAEAARQAGAFDYVTKPLDAEKVISAVDAAVAHFDYVHADRAHAEYQCQSWWKRLVG